MTDRAIGILVHGDPHLPGARHWEVRQDWLKPVIPDERMRGQLYYQARLYWEAYHRQIRNERVRKNWFHRNGLWADYLPKPVTGPVPLKFSLWDQAETRHKGDKAVRTNE